MWKKLLSLILVLTLVCSALPMTALADTFEELVNQSRLSAAELSRAQALIAMDDSVAHWESGQAITSSSNPRQVEEYLESLLDLQIEGLLLSVQDISSLTNNTELDELYSDTLNLHNEVDYYQQVIENGRSTLRQQLDNLNQGTLVEQYRLNLRIRETMQTLEDAIQHVSTTFASNSGSYEDQLSGLTSRFKNARPTNALQAQANLGDSNAQDAVSQLLSTSAHLTAQEQNHTNVDKEFTIKVLHSHLFAFEILDTNGQPISGAKVTVTSANEASNVTGEGTSDADGLVSFLVSSFTPDEYNTVNVNVTVEKNGYGVREAEGLHIKGGNYISFRLASAKSDTYLRMASFNGMDVLSQQETVYYTPQNDEKLSFDVKAVTPSGKGTLTLCYQTEKSDGALVDHTVKKSFTNGEKVSFTDKWLQKLAPGGKVSIQLEANEKTYPFDISLRVDRAVVDSPVTKFDQAFRFLNEAFSFTFPESIPFLGGDTMSMNMPMPKVNLLIEPSGHILLAYGKNYTDEKDRWKKEPKWQKQARHDEEAREGERDANAVENGVYQGSPAIKTKFLGTAAATFTPLATFQGMLGLKPGSVTDKAFALSGYAGMQGTFDADFTATMWVMGFPLFLCMNVTFALGTAAALDMEWDWDGKNLTKLSLSKGSGWIIDFMTELGVSIGVGIKNLLSAAVRFYGRLSSSLKGGFPSTASVKFSIGLTVVIQVLIAKFTHPLCHKTYLDTATGANSLLANDVQESPTVLSLSNVPGQNIVYPSTVEPDTNDDLTSGLKAVHTTQVAKLESVAQEVKYVTLSCSTQSGETKTNTFAFWITPTGLPDRTAELVWYNLNESGKNGKVILDGRSAAVKTMREIGTDYAFALMGSEDMVAVTVIGGNFYSSGTKLEACSADVAVMQMDASGQLTVKDYEQIRHAQPFIGEGMLSQPMVFLQKSPIDPVAYFATAGCAEIGSASDQFATHAYFTRMFRKSSEVYTRSDTTEDHFSDTERMSTFVMTTPINMTLDGSYHEYPDDYALRCYYCLGQDPNVISNEEAAENGEAYQANLYLYLNGEHKQIDENVSFIAPLAMVTDISGKGNDGKDYLFYLKRITESDGTKSYRLKNVCLEGGAKLTVTDMGINIPTGRFNTTVVPKKHVAAGETYGTPYLYWLEYATKATGEESGSETTNAYRLRAVTFDRKANLVYEPYTLAELEVKEGEKPNSAYVYAEPQSDAQGFFRVYYTCEPESADNDAGDARLSQNLYQSKATLAAGAEFTGIVMKDPCASPGKHATLLFSLKNTGNVPINAVLVQVLLNDKEVGNILISCNKPINSVNEFFTNSAYTVTRVPNVFDNHNGDFWVQETQTTDLSKDSVQNTTTVNATNQLMPGGVHTYEAGMLIPKDWNGVVKLAAKIKRIYFQQDIQNGLADLTANTYTPITQDGVYMVDENGVVSSVIATNNSKPGIQTVRVGNADDTKETLGEGRGDLSLYCQEYKADDGKQFVRVNIVGRSTTNSSVEPTLTAIRDDGVQVMHHTFANHIDEDYAYTLDIPASYLLKGAKNGYITFNLMDNEAVGAASAEFSNYDNQRKVWLGELLPLRIVQHPVSAEVMVGSDATFTVVAADGKMPYIYQWQRQNANGEWENLSGENEAQLTLTALTAMDNGAQFRCIVGDRYGNTVTSNPALLKVVAQPPVTGDNAQPMLWAALALMTLLVASWLVTKRRRNA